MLPYILIGMLIMLGALLRLDTQRAGPQRISASLLACSALLIVFIGLRHHVGMDWNNYLIMMARADYANNLLDSLRVTEPGYSLILMIASTTDLGIYVANFLSALIVVPCLVAWARRTPEPWLALLAAYPFFIMVFLMSANRQALAAACFMGVMAVWDRLNIVQRTALIFGCAMFHYSVLILLVFVALDLQLRREIKVVAVFVMSGISIYALQNLGQASYYNNTYGLNQEEVLESQGALFHVALNFIPASLYFLFPKARAILFPNALIRNMAFAAMLTLPMALVLSTAASRINFYWTPMAMYVLAALPGVIAQQSRQPVRLLASLLVLAVAPIWLLTANSAQAYIPYQNMLTADERELETRWDLGARWN